MNEYNLTYLEIEALIKDTATSRLVSEEVAKKSTVDVTASQALTHALASNGVAATYATNPRVDDGVAPTAPLNVSADPLIHGLGATWDAPASVHKVKLAKVRVTPQGGSAITHDAATLINHQVVGLEGNKLHTVEVSFIDAFGEQSLWSNPVSVTPTQTVAEEIDFSFAEVFGELGYTNIEQLSDPNKLGDNVVSGRSIVAHNAAMFNLWAGNAMIESAKIAEVVADKISTGTLVATTIALSSTGKIQAGAFTTFDAAGVTLAQSDTWDLSAVESSYRISAEDESAALWFFDQVADAVAADNYKGAILRSDGNATGPSTGNPGGTILISTRNGDVTETATRAYINILAGRPGFNGAVFTGGRLITQDGIRVRGSFLGTIESATASLAAGITGTLAHTLSAAPHFFIVQYSDDQVTWREANNDALWNVRADATHLRATNNTGSTQWVRMRAWA